ncbi:hypothetical protein IscW_ISCW018051, partial [Ixodes scapularis]
IAKPFQTAQTASSSMHWRGAAACTSSVTSAASTSVAVAINPSKWERSAAGLRFARSLAFTPIIPETVFFICGTKISMNCRNCWRRKLWPSTKTRRRTGKRLPSVRSPNRRRRQRASKTIFVGNVSKPAWPGCAERITSSTSGNSYSDIALIRYPFLTWTNWSWYSSGRISGCPPVTSSPIGNTKTPSSRLSRRTYHWKEAPERAEKLCQSTLGTRKSQDTFSTTNVRGSGTKKSSCPRMKNTTSRRCGELCSRNEELSLLKLHFF